jgi:hypothetical protein
MYDGKQTLKPEKEGQNNHVAYGQHYNIKRMQYKGSSLVLQEW